MRPGSGELLAEPWWRHDDDASAGWHGLPAGKLRHARRPRRVKHKVGYLLRSTLSFVSRSGPACPSCGGTDSNVIARKWVVTELRRCRQCRLLFRAPVTPPERVESYYQEDYESGMTTRMPCQDELRRLQAEGFRGTEKDFTRYIAILSALGVAPGSHVLDYGCSWGYGTWQLQQAGYVAVGFEVSEPRARYAAEKLGVNVSSRLPASAARPFDAGFSAHVLEHVAGVAAAFEMTMRLLRPVTGIFIAITPNGCMERKRRDPQRWRNAWGLKHPNLLDDAFWRRQMNGRSFLITTDLADLDALSCWARGETSCVGRLDGEELLAACRV